MKETAALPDTMRSPSRLKAIRVTSSLCPLESYSVSGAHGARMFQASEQREQRLGNEQAGLTNEEMLACQTLVHIPANPEFSSLNLAQAVQVVAYELFMVSFSRVFKMRGEKPATVADREGLYEHLERAAVASEFFDPASGSRLPTRLRRLFSRVPDLEREEVNILRGLLNALQKPKSK